MTDANTIREKNFEGLGLLGRCTVFMAKEKADLTIGL